MTRLQEIQYLADDEAKKISSSPRDWMGYLDMAAKLYRYPFSDTMLIHAQRPGASACALMEDWKGKWRFWPQGYTGAAQGKDCTGRIRILML